MSTSQGQNHPTVITSFEQTPLSGRRPYVSMSGPPSPSSPLARSHYMPDASSGSEEDSPAPTVLMTPTLTAATRGTSPPKGAESYFKTADHAALSSLSHLPSPGVSTENDHNGGNVHNRMGSFPFPLLPPHHPLRGQMYSSNGDANKINLDSSPPSTPKGHPVDPKIRYPKDPKAKMYPISRPYGGTSAYPRSATMSLPSLRVSRRLRSLLLVVFCCFVFGVVLVNNAASNAAATIRGNKQHPIYLDSFAHQQAVELGKRQDELADLKDKREKSRFAILAEMAEKAIQAPVAVPMKFENTREELAAVIAFVTSTTANALPELDPSKPLDPGMVLDFDPTRSGARDVTPT